MPRLKVLLVDDHAVVRSGLKLLIGGQSDMDVVAVAADASEAIRRASRVKPDVAVLDLAMPGIDSMEGIRRLLRARPGIRVVVLSRHEDTAYAASALDAGASAYIAKRAADKDLFAAIRAESRGRPVAEGVRATRAAQRRAAEREARRGRGALLSPRESQVLRMLGQGYNNRQIAIRLRLSVKTVETFRARLSKKIGLRGRPSLVRYALRTGLLTFEQLAGKGDD